MRFTVGGQEYDLTKEQVINAVKDMPIEPIRKCLVEIGGTAYPPKQVFGAITGRTRQSFTTMEAQRVLMKLGFVCRRVGSLDDGTPAWTAADPTSDANSLEGRLTSLESAMGTALAAIAGLQVRLSTLEGSS